jgi:kynurenine formamidase
MDKFFYSFLLIFLLISCNEDTPLDWEKGSWIDLSHAYESSTPYWPTASGFQFDTVFAGITEGGYYYSAYEFKSAEHGGTHIDAPIHFAEGKMTVDEIQIDQLIGPAVVIDVQDSVAGYIDYQIGIQDFLNWEDKYGEVPEGSIVLLRTGISKFWPNKEKYMGTALTGPAGVALLHFPGLHPDAAQWLIDNRKIKAIGLDTPSIDYGRSSGFLSHRILMEKNIPAFENLANLSALPENNFHIVALPMKIKGGSGGPLRIAAFVPQ